MIEKIKYKLSSLWSSFTYIFRKPYYRLRLFKRFMKYSYYGPWEVCDVVMEIAFETFCEYYEQCGIENIKPYDTTKAQEGEKEFIEHCNWRIKEQKKLYKWWVKDKKRREEEIQTLLDEWAKHHISWDVPCEEGLFEYKTKSTQYCKYLFNLLNKEEEKFEKEKERAFIKLVKLRNYFWD